MKSRFISSAFIGACILTEFWYIHIYGGILRPYHFFAVILIVLCMIQKPKISVPDSILLFLAFICISFIASIFGEPPSQAVVSFFSLLANSSIAIAIFIILQRGYIKQDRFYDIYLYFTLATIIWGLAQYLAYAGNGTLLALTEIQGNQIEWKLIPSFMTESNTFGVFCITALSICIPYIVRKKNRIFILIAFLLILVSILNFTRIAILGFIMCLPFIVLYYMSRGNMSRFSKYIIVAVLAGAFGVMIILSGLFDAGELVLFKILSVFRVDTFASDPSGGYRISMMREILIGSFDSIKTILIGKGWGQTYYVIQERLVQAWGGDILTIYGYTGLLGAVFFVFYKFYLIITCYKILKTNINDSFRLFVESTLFSCISLFTMALFAGMMIKPEYFIMTGAMFYIDYMYKKMSQNDIFKGIAGTILPTVPRR